MDILPPEWSEHTAPTGHVYYYNKITKQSTYTRPQQEPTHLHCQYQQPLQQTAQQPPQQPPQQQPPQQYQPQRQRQQQPTDRPKRKEIITNYSPWILVYTRLGRRFVHNTTTKESFWKFPPDVMKAVISHDHIKFQEQQIKDIDEREIEKAQKEKDLLLRKDLEEDEDLLKNDTEVEKIWVPPSTTHNQAGDDSSEYEEVEVTDSEFEDEDEKNEQVEEDQHMEFNEDDIEWQLSHMEEDMSETNEDAEQIFHALLSSYKINPFTPWSSIISSSPPHPILFDPDFTILSSAALRQKAYDSWSRAEISSRKQTLDVVSKEDQARIDFWTLLDEKSTQVSKLYWIEFKRKYKKEKGMVGGLKGNIQKWTEREMERGYKDFIKSMKLPLEQKIDDLKKLVRESNGDEIRVLRELKYWIVPKETREDLLKVDI